MRFYQFISTIIHPIVIPTVSVMLYFLLTSNNFLSNQKFAILSLVFVTTYLIPLFILILFKRLNMIKTYQTESIKERKLPVALMIVLCFLLGNTMNHLDLGLLFYASSIGLLSIYILFFFKLKGSIHLFALGITAGFFMVLSNTYSQSYLVVIIAILILSGIVASARLHLKAHSNKEIYIGFFTGMLSPIITNCLL